MRQLISIALAAGLLAPPAAMAQDPGSGVPSWHDDVTVAEPGNSDTLPGDPAIELEEVAGGLVDPVNVAFADDGSGRIFVVERNGVVRIVRDGALVEEPFLDISDQVLATFLEAGLYDIAFDPDFSENGYVYAHFAEVMANGDSRIVRYTVPGDTPGQIDPDSAKLIMTIDQPWANHNGGELAFGPDGYLYIATLLGKVLRIDVNVPEDAVRPYTIPADNPFADQAGLVTLFGVTEEEFSNIHTEARPEIWAYGLRNPWKFHFDPETGDLYLPDVGQNHWEEINVQPASSEGGENYGWDTLMGTHCFPIQSEDCARVGTLPVAEYAHDLGCAVVGLGVYRGGEIEGLDGVYLAGDYCSGRIWGLAQTDDGNWDFPELLASNKLLTAGGTGPEGDVYVTSCQCNYGGPQPTENPPGTLWRIAAANDQQ